MRRTFRKCGYVKERQGGPLPLGLARSRWDVYDAVGYAILHPGWQVGIIILPDWDDEPL